MNRHCFEIELTENPKFSKIFMDGKAIAVRSIKIEALVGEITYVTIEVPATVKGIINSEIDIKEGNNA